MAARKQLVLCVFVVICFASVVRADSITWPSSTMQNWTTWLAAQAGGSGGGLISSGDYYSPLPVTPVPQIAAPQPAPAPALNVITNAPQGVGVPAAMSSSGPLAPTSPTPTPSVSASAPSTTLSASPVDAFLNLGTGPYPSQSTITTGNAQPWYNSQAISSFFGGPPTAQQQQSFDNAVLQHVQQTFSQSGVPITVTTDPNVSALHTISLVSNTGSATVNNAIGMTQLGGNGFSFIDQSAKSAQSLDQLEWIVAHNVAHEMMLAFGVPENYDQTGNYIDAKVATFSMMVNPNATFSPAASQAISQALSMQNSLSPGNQQGAQLLDPLPAAIPEPTTWGMWALAAATVLVVRRMRRPRTAG